MAGSDGRYARRVGIFRALAVLTVVLGAAYLTWRYAYSLNYDAPWFAIPLVAAETYAFVNMVLFVVMMWRPTRRVSLPPLEGVTVDVFITTYDEPVELVRLTVEAAVRIDWPQLKVYVLDDGARAEMQTLAAKHGAGYVTRGEEWTGKPRHAKAGNVNNALMRTDGEFILILDADQIPDPSIIRKTIGYFRDPALAFVQTPQQFYNLPAGDPFGSDAPLFYGPIMQGKDGWNAAFFCGSNAVLRREALLQLGVTEYVREMEGRFHDGLKALRHDVSSLYRHPRNHPAIQVLRSTLEAAYHSLQSGAPLQRVSNIVREGVAVAQEVSSHRDLLTIADTLKDMAEAGDADAGETRRYLLDNIAQLTREVKRDAKSLGLAEAALEILDLTRTTEAQPVLPLATFSVTEDMATAMRLHALGWKSVFHPETLAYGLAPEDLGSALGQRLRWAQGTLQVMVQENPLFKKGLSFGQRIQYCTTILSYFSGFSSLVFLLCPIVYLLTGVPPIRARWEEFLLWLTPYLVLNRVMFFYVSHGISVWRSEQYSLALFPLWIRAVVSVVSGRRLEFVVTPKQRQLGRFLGLVWPQIAVISLTALAVCYGCYSLVLDPRGSLASIPLNMLWGAYNVVMLFSIVRAAVYRPPKDESSKPPSFLLAPP